MRYIILISVLAGFIACSNESEQASKTNKLFTSLPSSSTNIDFINVLSENKDTNIYKYGYLYNGGGVGIGDLNNDGLADIVLSATMSSSKVYLNKGNMKFEDISKSSGISSFGGMHAGISMVDINNDGWLDVYICRQSFTYNASELSNLLFINNKDNTFSEVGESYNLADKGYSSQAAFFDMDGDGDLDCYVLNHPGEFSLPLDNVIEKVKNPSHDRSDHLYRNDNGKFKDVTIESGILNYGYGLGIVIGDLDKDDDLDIYVTNDFAPHDYYYVNNGDGTFTESLQNAFKHCSYFSMGADLADLNNDTYLDLFVVEMLSEDNQRQKTNMAPMDMDRFAYMVDNNLYYQYMRNSLNINNTNGTFSDWVYYSGIDKTDWSWGNLFGDYDNDGDDDLLVVNGYLRDTQDKDFTKKSNELAKSYNNQLSFDQVYSILESTPLTNYIFENTGEIKFEKRTQEWGFDHSGYSNGVAIGDLDNDGDIDIVVNNINDEASVYENNTNDGNYIGFKIKEGPPTDKLGLFTSFTLFTDLGKYYKELNVVRGFQSSVQPLIHFGLSNDEQVEKVIVTWPNGLQETILSPKRSAYHEISYSDKLKRKDNKDQLNQKFSKINSPIAHSELIYNDYKKEVLLPHKLSQLGPASAVGDVNGDKLDDIFIGGSRSYSGKLYIQKNDGSFIESQQNAFFEDRKYEDVTATFLDIDNDGDLDLYVGSGSNEYALGGGFYQDRIYINQEGNFKADSSVLPTNDFSTGIVKSGDFDNDGDLDLFVSARLTPEQYPMAPSSKIYVNQEGKYYDKTEEICPSLLDAGMITTAEWTDFNNDGQLDLIVAGEWTDIIFLKNNGEILEPKNMELSPLVGWWNVIKAIDLDQDGDMDYVIGNLGENYKYQASNDKAFEIYSGDFDDNGKRDIALGYYSGEELFPVRGFQCSSEQIPTLKKKFDSYSAFGNSNLIEIYGDKLKSAIHYQANIFKSIILRNEGESFSIEYLPYQAQVSPIQDLLFKDLNGDNFEDIILAGNWYVSEIETPRADSGTGLILMSQNNGKNFKAISFKESGFYAQGDVRRLHFIEGQSGVKLIVVNNNDVADLFTLNQSQ